MALRETTSQVIDYCRNLFSNNIIKTSLVAFEYVLITKNHRNMQWYTYISEYISQWLPFILVCLKPNVFL